jgi:hypothetical protein
LLVLVVVPPCGQVQGKLRQLLQLLPQAPAAVATGLGAGGRRQDAQTPTALT